MQLNHTPDWNQRTRRRSRLPLVLMSFFGGVTVAAVALTLLFVGGRLPFGNQVGVSGASSGLPKGVTPHPLSHVPTPTASASLPPLGAHFQPSDNATPLATPCPVQSTNGHTDAAPTNTPLPVRLTPPPRTATPGTGAIPVCGNGQLPGPRCYTTRPGPEPTQDQVRQTMYNLAVSTGFLNFSLIEAEGWQESGWQENVVACDGGIGVMQIQPDTVTWLNQTYNTNYDPYTLADNVNLGINMLQWLYNYYIPYCNQGMPTGQTCTWDTVWPGATDGATVRQIVISSYNQGVGTTANYGIQNWQYVNNVMSLRAQFLAAEQSS
jgi:hypothetical protein